MALAAAFDSCFMVSERAALSPGTAEQISDLSDQFPPRRVIYSCCATDRLAKTLQVQLTTRPPSDCQQPAPLVVMTKAGMLAPVRASLQGRRVLLVEVTAQC